jgi:hypothetical protein
MSNVFIHLGLSLDGYIAGPNRGPKNPLGDGGPSIHAWLFGQRAFRQHLQLGDDGETAVNQRLTFGRRPAAKPNAAPSSLQDSDERCARWWNVHGNRIARCRLQIRGIAIPRS